MRLQINPNPTIEDLRRHATGRVDELRELLAAGAPARVDPHRKDFYDVQSRERVYYIHVRPNGRVWLLAAWPKSGARLARQNEPVLACASPC